MIGTNSAAASSLAAPSRSPAIVTDARPRQDRQELFLGRGGFEQAVMLLDPPNDKNRQ
jgi:hypothetical protein